jgi:hypothetical protein
VQIDVAKIKKESGEGGSIMQTIQKEMEDFKKKMEEAQALGLRKHQA